MESLRRIERLLSELELTEGKADGEYGPSYSKEVHKTLLKVIDIMKSKKFSSVKVTYEWKAGDDVKELLKKVNPNRKYGERFDYAVQELNKLYKESKDIVEREIYYLDENIKSEINQAVRNVFKGALGIIPQL